MDKVKAFREKKESIVGIYDTYIEELLKEIGNLSGDIERLEKEKTDIKLETMRVKERNRELENILTVKDKQMELLAIGKIEQENQEIKQLKMELEKQKEISASLVIKAKEYEDKIKCLEEKAKESYEFKEVMEVEHSNKIESDIKILVEDIENTFNKSKSKKGFVKLDSEYIDIAEEKIKNLIEKHWLEKNNISQVDAYVLIEIAGYCGVLNELIDSSSYIEELFENSLQKYKVKNADKVIEEKNIVRDKEVKQAKPVEKIEVINNEEKKIKKIYISIVDSFYKSSAAEVKNHLVEMYKNKDEEKYLDDTEKLTTLFINCISNTHIPTLEKDLHYHNIKKGYETILYKRVIEDNPYVNYIESYGKMFSKIDSKVKTKILDTLILMYKAKHEVEKETDYNLSEESELKKLGYSTSLGRDARWNVLRNKAIPKLGKKKVESHLRWLIKMNKGRKNRGNAVSEWEFDLRRTLNL